MTALALVLAATLAAEEPSMRVDSYREALDAIATRLDAGDTRGAAGLATSLSSARVDWEGEPLLPDPALLAAIARGRGTEVRPALDALRAALSEKTGVAADVTAEDRRTLERLGSERLEARRGGAALPGMPEVEIPWRERVVQWLASAARWVGRKLVALFRWLQRWWSPSEKPLASPDTINGLARGVLVVVGIVAVLLVVLAADRGKLVRDRTQGPLAGPGRARCAPGGGGGLARPAHRPGTPPSGRGGVPGSRRGFGPLLPPTGAGAGGVGGRRRRPGRRGLGRGRRRR